MPDFLTAFRLIFNCTFGLGGLNSENPLRTNSRWHQAIGSSSARWPATGLVRSGGDSSADVSWRSSAGPRGREASWTAAVLCRLASEVSNSSRNTLGYNLSVRAAPRSRRFHSYWFVRRGQSARGLEDWRTPRPGGSSIGLEVAERHGLRQSFRLRGAP